MSMTDPIADLLTRIRNAQSAGKPTVGMGASKLKVAILKVLKAEGYIGAYGVDVAGAKSTLSIELKYHDGRPVIDRIERISRPGLRIYRGKDELPKVLGGLGVAVISTPQGIMSDAKARAASRQLRPYGAPSSVTVRSVGERCSSNARRQATPGRQRLREHGRRRSGNSPRRARPHRS